VKQKKNGHEPAKERTDRDLGGTQDEKTPACRFEWIPEASKEKESATIGTKENVMRGRPVYREQNHPIFYERGARRIVGVRNKKYARLAERMTGRRVWEKGLSRNAR